MTLNTTYFKRLTITSLLWLAVIVSLFAQEVPSVDAQAAFCYNGDNPTPISDFVNLTGKDDATLPGMQVSIGQNYDSTTDTLTFQSIHGVTASFDDPNGILTLTGSGSLVQYREVIQQIFFSTSAPAESGVKSIDIALSNLDYLPETGHFYQYFAQSGILWNPAKDSAASKTLFGLTGYLATITSEAESDFLIERVAGSAWIGATDEATEGTWRWVTGPEGEENGGQGRIISGFINWNIGEPNNCCGGEDFAHMMDWTNPPGRWNDLNNTSAPPGSPYHPTGYMVEYGGMSGDPDVFTSITGTTVLEPLRQITISGPVSICPNLSGVTYTAEQLPGYSYVWAVEGGTIAMGQGSHELTVDWGDTNANAKVSVKVMSDITCETASELPVVINVQLEPPLPTGPALVCYTDLTTTQVYNTLPSPGSDYNWVITGGQIVTGNGTNEIEVIWDGPGTGTLYFTESTSTATDICDGDSPLLTVDLREEIVPDTTIVAVSCFSGSDGSITINSVAGAAPFSYSWNTNGQGAISANGVSNLPAGDYSVDITSDGCTINMPFTITEPTELTGSMEAFDALCFGQASGIATAMVTGGTGSYTYQWSVNRPTDQATASNLPMGTYSVDVIDENDCVLTLNFEIGEPELLVIDSIAATLVTCPEGADGTLEAFVSGGTAPYTYSWQGSEDETALATGFAKGDYLLTVTDANGCIATASQTVEEATPKIFIPNAFSPNADGDNDTFGPTTTCDFNFQMTIYNRWGNIVFSTYQTTNPWNGTVNGQPAPSGKYSYTAAWSIIVNNELISEERRGTLRLFR